MQSLSARYCVFLIAGVCVAQAGSPMTPEQVAQLPPPAAHQIEFAREIKPILEASCIKCHGHGRDKGGLRLDTRQTLLKGSDSGAVLVPGKSTESLLIALVQGFDPDSVMPKKGTRLTPEQIGLLRAWIDQGAEWPSDITFGRPEPLNLKPRKPALPPGPDSLNPIDRLLQPYFAEHKFRPPAPVNDRLFARRAWLDIVGLLPTPEELKRFSADHSAHKRERLVQHLLGQDREYAENWLTFWNDLLRNDYRGTGYIDGGRKQITTWLYSALLTNMPYDAFVAQLINPGPESEGFIKGIVWRGVVNASQTPQMQAAQSISQVFMGVNLKCASCHDSFVNDLTLTDSYGLASIYADGPLEMVHCDKATGKTADPRFFYPELGSLQPDPDRKARLAGLAHIICQPADGRLTRTFVNRIWQRFMGRALVEPVDDMDKPAWNQDLLDWLAEDFAAHHYDVKHLLARILTSRAYQLPAVNLAENSTGPYVFRGPSVRRMTAEQFRDALTSITGTGYPSPLAETTPSPTEQKRFDLPLPMHWIWNDPHAATKARAGRVYFRKELELSAVPDEATALVVCDNRFTFYVNGNLAGSGSEFKTAFVLDVKRFLHPGRNLIAVDAINLLPDSSLPTPDNALPGTENPAGLLVYARLRTTAGATNDFVTDRSWICSDNLEQNWEKPQFKADGWKKAVELGGPDMLPWRVGKGYLVTRLASAFSGPTRAALVAADPLTTALGRPNREQVVTTRPAAATTLQALELTNGQTLADILSRGAKNIMAEQEPIQSLFEKALGRRPSADELRLANEMVGTPPKSAGLEDLIWTLAMLPEFQLIY